jgi:hypothetical protein
LFVADEVLAVNTLITMTLVMPAELVGGAGASVTCVGRVVRVLPSSPHGRPTMAASITKYRLLPGEQKRLDAKEACRALETPPPRFVW